MCSEKQKTVVSLSFFLLQYLSYNWRTKYICGIISQSMSILRSGQIHNEDALSITLRTCLLFYFLLKAEEWNSQNIINSIKKKFNSSNKIWNLKKLNSKPYLTQWKHWYSYYKNTDLNIFFKDPKSKTINFRNQNCNQNLFTGVLNNFIKRGFIPWPIHCKTGMTVPRVLKQFFLNLSMFEVSILPSTQVLNVYLKHLNMI